jgi:hypothetical protein
MFALIKDLELVLMLLLGWIMSGSRSKRLMLHRQVERGS